jgi:uroporphyrinogen-III synthase
VPVLTFEFPHQDRVRGCLSTPDAYAALVATSPRAVTAVARVFDAHPALQKRWQGRTAFAVGPSTARAWNDLGLIPEGQSAGGADALVEHIAASVSATEQPLLFLSGNRRRDALPEGLAAHNIPYHEQEAYVTVPRSDLSLPALGDDRPMWVVFFSPSGLDAVQQSSVALDSYRVGAIGPTTARRLRAEGLRVDAVAETPSPPGLAAALQRA